MFLMLWYKFMVYNVFIKYIQYKYIHMKNIKIKLIVKYNKQNLKMELMFHYHIMNKM